MGPSGKGRGKGKNTEKSNKKDSSSKQSWSSGKWQQGGQDGWTKKDASGGSWSGADSEKWKGGNNWNSNDKWSNNDNQKAGSSWNSSGHAQGWSSQKSSWNGNWQGGQNNERRGDWKGSYGGSGGKPSYDHSNTWGNRYDQRSSDRGYERPPPQERDYDRGYQRPPPSHVNDRHLSPPRRREERDYAYTSTGGRSSQVFKESHRPSREPRTIAVGNIAKLRVDKRDLEKAFESVGRVERSILSGSLAYITFCDPKDARDAVRRFHGGQLNDQTIEVYFAEPGGFGGDRGRAAGGRSRTPPGHRGSSGRAPASLPPPGLPSRGGLPDRRRQRSLTPQGAARAGGSPGVRRPRR